MLTMMMMMMMMTVLDSTRVAALEHLVYYQHHDTGQQK
jgi:hypothetical protein